MIFVVIVLLLIQLGPQKEHLRQRSRNSFNINLRNLRSVGRQIWTKADLRLYANINQSYLS
jgi:hypothetical protein